MTSSSCVLCRCHSVLSQWVLCSFHRDRESWCRCSRCESDPNRPCPGHRKLDFGTYSVSHEMKFRDGKWLVMEEKIECTRTRCNWKSSARCPTQEEENISLGAMLCVTTRSVCLLGALRTEVSYGRVVETGCDWFSELLPGKECFRGRKPW